MKLIYVTQAENYGDNLSDKRGSTVVNLDNMLWMERDSSGTEYGDLVTRIHFDKDNHIVVDESPQEIMDIVETLYPKAVSSFEKFWQ